MNLLISYTNNLPPESGQYLCLSFPSCLPQFLSVGTWQKLIYQFSNRADIALFLAGRFARGPEKPEPALPQEVSNAV